MQLPYLCCTWYLRPKLRTNEAKTSIRRQRILVISAESAERPRTRVFRWRRAHAHQSTDVTSERRHRLLQASGLFISSSNHTALPHPPISLSHSPSHSRLKLSSRSIVTLHRLWCRPTIFFHKFSVTPPTAPLTHHYLGYIRLHCLSPHRLSNDRRPVS